MINKSALLDPSWTEFLNILLRLAKKKRRGFITVLIFLAYFVVATTNQSESTW